MNLRTPDHSQLQLYQSHNPCDCRVLIHRIKELVQTSNTKDARNKKMTQLVIIQNTEGCGYYCHDNNSEVMEHH